MAFYSVGVVAFATVAVEADDADEAQMLAMDADAGCFTIAEAKGAVLLTTDEQIAREKRYADQVMMA